MRLTANSDTALCGPAGIGETPILHIYPPCVTLNHSETPILHGGPLGTNHRETLLGGAVREGISLNHSETLLALA